MTAIEQIRAELDAAYMDSDTYPDEHACADVAALLDVAEAAQRMVTSASAHFRCPLCDKNGHGYISACPVLALRTALDLLPQKSSEGEL